MIVIFLYEIYLFKKLISPEIKLKKKLHDRTTVLTEYINCKNCTMMIYDLKNTP